MLNVILRFSRTVKPVALTVTVLGVAVCRDGDGFRWLFWWYLTKDRKDRKVFRIYLHARTQVV